MCIRDRAPIGQADTRRSWADRAAVLCYHAAAPRRSSGRAGGASELSVAGVAKARNNEAFVVQSLVDRGGDDAHRQRRFRQDSEALRRNQGADGRYVRGAARAQQLDRVRHRTSGRQHRIEHVDGAAGEAFGQRQHVLRGQQGVLVAGHADEAHLGVRKHGLGLVGHAQACPQYRHQQWRIGQVHPSSGRDRRIDRPWRGAETAGCLVDQHHRQLPQSRAEGRVCRSAIPHDREPGSDQRMIDHDNVEARRNLM